MLADYQNIIKKIAIKKKEIFYIYSLLSTVFTVPLLNLLS